MRPIVHAEPQLILTGDEVVHVPELEPLLPTFHESRYWRTTNALAEAIGRLHTAVQARISGDYQVVVLTDPFIYRGHVNVEVYIPHGDGTGNIYQTFIPFERLAGHWLRTSPEGLAESVVAALPPAEEA